MDESRTFSKSEVTTESSTTSIKEDFNAKIDAGSKFFSASATMSLEKTASATVTFANTVTYRKNFDASLYDTDNYRYSYAILANLVKVDIYELSGKINMFTGEVTDSKATYVGSEIRVSDTPDYIFQRLYIEK